MKTNRPVEVVNFTGGSPKSLSAGVGGAMLYPGVTVLALAAADVSALVLAFATAVVIARDMGMGEPPLDGLAAAFGLIVVMVGVMLKPTAQRHDHRGLPGDPELLSVLMASFVALIGAGLIELALQTQKHHMPTLVTWGMFISAAAFSRMVTRATFRKTGQRQRRVVVVGHGQAAAETARFLQSEPRQGYVVAGVLHPARIGRAQHGRWLVVLSEHQAELIVLAMDDPSSEIADSLVSERVPFAVTTCHDTVVSRPGHLGLPIARVTKISLDLLLAFGMVVLLAPLLIAIAIAVKLDGGPVLYAHRRIGAGERRFSCFKFRSMSVDGDEVLRRLLVTDPVAAAEWAATHKLRHDPRVTPIGRLLRSTSLDELPQLFNVLRLDMSLVGPRPIVPAEVPRYGHHIHEYYAIRPGLTGLWQVSGRSNTGYAERVQLDSWYVRNWSLSGDIMILLRTVPAVLKRRGAV